jgi:hypothetical protein
MSSTAAANDPAALATPGARAHPALVSLGVAVTAGLLVLFMFSPRLCVWQGLTPEYRLPFPEIHRAHDALLQLRDPWAKSDTYSNAVLSWRLLFPLIWYYGHLSPTAFLVMPFVCCPITLWLVAWLTFRRLQNWQQTWVITALFAALPWYFVSTGWLAYFDSWLMLGILTVAFVPSRAAVAVACLLTPWIDERFILALPVALTVRAIALDQIEQRAWRSLLLDLAFMVAASVPYLGVRAAAWMLGDAGSSDYVQQYWTEMRAVPVSRFLEGLWSGFRAGWLLIGAAICFTGQRIGWKWGGLFAAIVLLSSVASLFIAADMSRTLSIEAPVMLLGAWLWCEDKIPKSRYVLPAILAANLLLPAAHVVWPFTINIRYLYDEIDNYRNPPRELQADTYFQMAKEMREQGNRVGAEWGYSIAIQLDRRFAEAYAGRASIRLEQGKIDEGVADLEKSLQLKPDLADALLMRAAARRSRGDIAGAIQDLRKALADAPPDWSLREQTQQYLDDLQSKAVPPPKFTP